jgi:hypothetical protein
MERNGDGGRKSRLESGGTRLRTWLKGKVKVKQQSSNEWRNYGGMMNYSDFSTKEETSGTAKPQKIARNCNVKEVFIKLNKTKQMPLKKG